MFFDPRRSAATPAIKKILRPCLAPNFEALMMLLGQGKHGNAVISGTASDFETTLRSRMFFDPRRSAATPVVKKGLRPCLGPNFATLMMLLGQGKRGYAVISGTASDFWAILRS
jgi:hypothetical protein